MTEALVRAFPDRLPYGGIHEEVVPHLTVAHGAERLVDGITRELEPDRSLHPRRIRKPAAAWLCRAMRV